MSSHPQGDSARPPLATWEAEKATIARLLARRALPDLGATEAEDLARRHDLEPSELLRRLVAYAEERAHAPLSRFRAGAVARGLSGALYLGANLEFPGAPIAATIHAEQSAAHRAFLAGERGLTHLAVGAPPCGLCRQFLMELAGATELLLVLPGGEAPLGRLLPTPFGPQSLGVEERWMAGATGDSSGPGEDAAARARAAAARSHAPYTGAREGVVLVDRAGGLHVGLRVESAAFNPTLTAVGAALSEWNLAGRPGLARALHACVPSAAPATAEAAAELLRGAVGLEVERIALGAGDDPPPA